MKKGILLFICCFVFLGTSFGQKTFTDLISWEKSPTSSANSANSVYGLDDGGWLVTHYSYADDLRLVVSRFNECGDFIWSKKYGNENTDYLVRGVLVNQSGDIVLMGIEKIGQESYNSFLIQLSSDGEVNYYVKFGFEMNDIPYFIEENEDGNYIMMINMDQYPGLRIICFSPDGNVVWAKGYNNDHIWGYGGLTSTGNILCRTGSKHFMLDKNGTLLWGRYIPLAYNSSFPLEIENGFVYSVWTNQGDVLYKLNSQGDIVWQKSMPNITAQHLLLQNDSIQIFGLLGGQSNQTGLITMDKNGVSGQVKYLDYGLENIFFDVNVASLVDSSVLISGNIRADESKVVVVKLDKTLTQGCDLFLEPYESQDLDIMTSEPTPFVQQDVDINASFESIESADNVLNITRFCQEDIVLPRPFPEDTLMCYGQVLTLDFDTPLFDVLWSTGSTNQSIDVEDNGTYSVGQRTVLAR